MKEEKTRSSSHRPNARIWSHANTFEKSALLCLENNLAQPMGVNAALAIELYLKSFLAIDIISTSNVENRYSIDGFTSEHGHSFTKLISKMEASDKDLLFSQLKVINSKRNWEKQFKNYENIFIKVRYWYETKNYTGIDYDIVTFAEELGRAVKEVGLLKENKYS